MRTLIEVTAEQSGMQGIERVSIGPEFSDVLMGKDRLIQDWDNPDPVVVLLQPIKFHGKLTLLVGRRQDQPHIGRLAHIAGFIEKGESPEQAACREFEEETGFGSLTPMTMALLTAEATPNGKLLIFVANHLCLQEGDLKDLLETKEMAGFGAWMGSRMDGDLAFPLHTEVGDRWLRHHAHRDETDIMWPSNYKNDTR